MTLDSGHCEKTSELYRPTSLVLSKSAGAGRNVVSASFYSYRYSHSRATIILPVLGEAERKGNEHDIRKEDTDAAKNSSKWAPGPRSYCGNHPGTVPGSKSTQE